MKSVWVTVRDVTAPGDGTFAVELRRLREARGLTQEALAERSGITVKAVGALERGERTRPYPHTVRSLADALGLDEAGRVALAARIPRRSSGGRTTTMPSPPSRLIGREADVARVRDLLHGGSRLVTITGPGGVGKTRVVLEVLAREAHDYSAAVFVELAAVRDPSLVLPHVAAALGIPERSATETVAGLAPALSGRSLLIALDNLEQLLPAAPLIADLVAHCPELVVLATSRAALRVRAEHDVLLGPLSTPATDALDDVRSSPAVQLFLDRTSAAGAGVVLADGNAGVVAAICRRVDGLPLAVELAAAGSRVLTPAAMLDRLGEHSPVPRDLTERQQSMPAAIEWSLALLDPGPVELFGRLGVFTGSFGLDAAEAIGDVDAFGSLAELTEHSLVTRVESPDDQPRFRLLEPLRQYAVQRLAGASAPAVRDRHAHYFHDRAMAGGAILRGSGLAVELDRLEADHAELRTAYLRLLERQRVGDAAEMVGTVWLYLALRGHAREALTWLDRLDDGASDEARCRAVTGRMGLLFATGDIAGMNADVPHAVALARRLGGGALAAEAMTLAGHAAVFTGDLDGARRVLETASEWSTAAEAAWVSVHARVAQGQLALASGDLDEAGRVLTTALEQARDLGNAFSLATALTRLATVTTLSGDDATTTTLLGESTELSVAARMSWTLSYSLPALAGVAVRLARPETAARLFGASASLSATHAVDPRFPVSRQLADTDLATARAALGDRAFAEAWDAGRTASQDEVGELARELTRLARG